MSRKTVARQNTELTTAQGTAALAAEEERRRRQRSHQQPRRSTRPGQLEAPEWVIVGCKVDAGARLYASRDLPDAEFGMDQIKGLPEHVLTTVMRDMLVVTRPTYPEALAELQRLWEARDRAKVTEDLAALERERRKAITA